MLGTAAMIWRWKVIELMAILMMGLLTLACAFSSARASAEVLAFALPKERIVRPNPDRPPLVNMTRDSMLFYLQTFTTQPFSIVADHDPDQDLALLDVDYIAVDVVDALRNAAEPSRYLDVFQALKDIVQGPAYLAHRNFKRPESAVPLTLRAFTARFPFADWERVIVPVSLVKGKTRVIYCGRGSPRVSIAQTHESTTGDADSPIRETEVIIEREDGSEDWDFFVYDADGDLVNTSEFVSGGGHSITGTAPMVCASCHYHPETRRFQNRPLTFGRMSYADRLQAPGCG